MNVLAIDQGTSATKALLVGDGGEVLGSAEAPVRTYPVGGDGVEADPEELWRSVEAAGARALASARAPAHAVALANQGETVLAWDPATGTPLSRAIVWQDRRSAAVCAGLAGQADELRAITGLPLDPYFAAPKMTWLREHVTRDGVVTTTDSWLLRRLGARYVTDAATASRTMLLDLDATAWSARACRAFGIAPETLPEIPRSARARSRSTRLSGRRPRCAGVPRSGHHRSCAGSSAPAGSSRGWTSTTPGTGAPAMFRVTCWCSPEIGFPTMPWRAPPA